MRQLTRYCLLLLMLSGVAEVTLSQSREYIYDHYKVSNGLIMDNVYRICIDSEGHAWITTYNGLQKYNGYEFMTYTSDPQVAGSLSSNYVEDIFEDRSGDMVVVLEDGIDIYDKRTGSFTNLVSGLSFAAARRNEISRQPLALQDRSGAIWVNCNNQLVKINADKRSFITFEDDYRGRFILNPDSTCLVIITDTVLKKYHLEKKVLNLSDVGDIPAPVSIQRLNTLFYDSGKNCWVGTSEGLFLYDETNNVFLDPAGKGLIAPAFSSLFTGKGITSIYEDYKHDLWIASGTQLYRLERQSGTVETLRHEMDNPNSILDGQITGIHGDRHSGIIWLTYLNKGITRINIRNRNFRTYRFRTGEQDGLGGNTVRSIFKDDSGVIWVGLYNNGLDRIDTRTGRITHYSHQEADRGTVCSNYISALYRDENDRLWVGSHDNGLCFADQVSSGTLRFRKPDFLNQNEEIYHILGDSLGRIWIGTRYGLGMYDYGTGSYQWILEEHNIQSFLIDGTTLWLATWNHGVCKLVFDGQEFESPRPRFDRERSLYYPTAGMGEGEGPDDRKQGSGLMNCISIYQDIHSRIWVGTFSMGLAKVDEKDGSLSYTLYDVHSGAPGNAIYGILGDREGNIWVSSEKGLGKFDPGQETFENFYREDGLLSDYFMWKAYHEAGDGELFFGCMEGLNLFYPDQIERDTVTAKIHFSEFRIQNRLVEGGDTVNGNVIMTTHINYADQLELNHANNRNFSFSFYATGPVNHQRIQYRYMLEGFDQDWNTDRSGNRMAVYNGLPPGTYLFKVMASTQEHFRDGSSREIRLTILPPWWKTRLAYTLYILIVLLLVFVIAHSLIRFIGLKHELQYNERLHQAKLMFFTNISHEFKTPLSLIRAPLNDILNQKELTPKNRKNLQVARHNADNLLNLVNELLEFRRTDTGVSRLRAEKVEMAGFLKEIVEDFECMAEQKKVQFYFNIPEEPRQVWVDREKFRKIINNLLENALKYTEAEGLVTLSLLPQPVNFKFRPDFHTLQLNNTRKNTDYVGILVSDTGVGISGESLPKVFERFYQIEAERASHHIGSGIGLALVKNLVLMHHGEIRIGSERGVGTEILVMFPLGDRHLGPDDLLAPLVADSFLQAQAGRQPAEEPDRLMQENREAQEDLLPRILIVEDHDKLRNYLRDQLSAEYRIMEAPNGAEALKIMHRVKPDLVITDWIMPVMDGEALIRTIRSNERLSTIPVILLTGKGDHSEHLKGLDMGADLVVPKPFSIQLLNSQVKRAVENNRSRIRQYAMVTEENINEIHEVRQSDFIGQLDRIILSNLRETNLNAGFLAREMGVSRTVLYEKVRVATGVPIGVYIQKTRLKRAIRLMLYENRPISEVYVMVGFSSSSYMIRLFRKHYQTTPGEYIRSMLKASSN